VPAIKYMPVPIYLSLKLRLLGYQNTYMYEKVRLLTKNLHNTIKSIGTYTWVNHFIEKFVTLFLNLYLIYILVYYHNILQM